jgi:hypothetical protein
MLKFNKATKTLILHLKILELYRNISGLIRGVASLEGDKFSNVLLS